MLRHVALAGAFLVALSVVSVRAQALPSADPSPAPTPSPDAQAERVFQKAREAWRQRSDVPYLRYGALVRYLHNGHVFDNWWDSYYRHRDGALALEPLHDIDEEKRRLGGVPFSIFGVKIFDTNRDAEPIRLDDPRIDPISSFGVLTRAPYRVESPRAQATASPEPSTSPVPEPQSSADYREIARVQANTRDYQIEVVGMEDVAAVPALHLKLTPLREPQINRLRDLWVDPMTYRTVQLNVEGVLGAKPYDSVKWTVRYVLLDGRNYVQQIIADEPLRFGFDTVIPKFEFDFVDYHFPHDVPRYTFDHSLLSPS